MADRDRNTRKKGFSFVSMLIGILIGIVVLVAALGGVVAYFLFADIDDVLDAVGLENEETDENGDTRYVYVNTEEVSSLWDIIMWVTSVEDYSEMTLGELSVTFPVVGTFTEELCDSLSEYIEIDPEEVENVKFNELGDWLVDKVEGINLVSVMNLFDMNMDDPIIEALFYGPEASYVEWEGEQYPVRYDEYEIDNDQYVRVSDDVILEEAFEKYIFETEDEDNALYRIYYATIDDESFVVTTEDEFEYYLATESEELVEYGAGAGKLTGNFYRGLFENDEGEEEYGRIVETYITLGDLMDDPMAGVYGLYITDLLSSEPGDMIYDLFEGMTLGELMDGSTDFGAIINDLELSMFLDVSMSGDSQAIMMYIIYGVSGIEEAEAGKAYDYTGTYSLITDNGREPYPCYIVTDEKNVVTGVYLDEACTQKATGTTIADVEGRMDGLMNDLTIGEIINLGSGNSIMNLISGSTINGLGSDIENLTLNQLLCDDIYGYTDEVTHDTVKASLKEAVNSGAGDGQIEFAAEYVYYTSGGSGILTLAGCSDGQLIEGDGKLTQEEFEALTENGYKVYTYGKAQSYWQLFLYKTETDASGVTYRTEYAYGLNNMGAMVENIAGSVNSATLRDLVDMNILTGVTETTLNTDLSSIKSTLGIEKDNLGDLTIVELINIIPSLLELLNMT